MERTIAGFARQGGVGVETVRYYQRRGLLPVPRKSGGIRRYGSEDVRKLRFIRSAQSAGFTLEEIGELLALEATNDRAKVRKLAGTRIAALDEKIARMKTAREVLAKLARQCAAGTHGPCPILSAFEQSF
jgi:MerR family mercuric resistance operon transcriptional regulator